MSFCHFVRENYHKTKIAIICQIVDIVSQSRSDRVQRKGHFLAK